MAFLYQQITIRYYNFGKEVFFTNHKALSAKNATGFNIIV